MRPARARASATLVRATPALLGLVCALALARALELGPALPWLASAALVALVIE